MISLRNTWCVATEENYDALTRLGLSPDMELYRDDKYLFVRDDGFCPCRTDLRKDKKQIHLVDGEFQYVEENQKDRHADSDVSSFEKYGFEKPDFKYVTASILEKVSRMDCEGLKDEYRNKSVYVGYLKANDGIITTIWDEDGTNGDFAEYNLTPLKKPWYENPDNFPLVLLCENPRGTDEFILLNDIHQYKRFEGEGIEFIRLATKQEILSLLVEEENVN